MDIIAIQAENTRIKSLNDFIQFILNIHTKDQNNHRKQSSEKQKKWRTNDESRMKSR